MTKAEKIKHAKVVAHWIKDLKACTILVRTTRKVYTGRGEWHLETVWNSSLDELKEFDLKTFQNELGLFTESGLYYLAEQLTDAGYKVFDEGAAIMVWNYNGLRANLEYQKARVNAFGHAKDLLKSKGL